MYDVVYLLWIKASPLDGNAPIETWDFTINQMMAPYFPERYSYFPCNNVFPSFQDADIKVVTP
jgi:hypothetical protein